MKKNSFIASAILFSLFWSAFPESTNATPYTFGQQAKLKSLSLRSAINNLGKQFGYQVYYVESDLQGLYVEETALQFKTMNESIDFLKRNFPLDFFVKDKVLTVKRLMKTGKQQHILVGVIRDQDNKPVSGVTIEFLNSSVKTLSQADGSYRLAVPKVPEKVLMVSHVGYDTFRTTIESQDQLDIKLNTKNRLLDEIVVIGYGEQSRAKIVGAVSKIDAKSLEKTAAASFEQQLAGKVSGVVINQADGQPGASAQIVIRGRGTLTAGASPLIVVDGFPLSEGNTLNSINPSDIASINILKDAASAAIYGSRAANGVILVTTKEGKMGAEKTKVGFDTYYGFQQQTSGVKLVDGYQLAQFLSEARDWGYVSKDPRNRSASDPNSVRVTKKINGKNIDGRELSLDYLRPYLDGQQGLTNTDWMDLAFRTAPMSNYNVNISGGGAQSKFYTSLGYFNQKGVVIGSDMQRYSAAVNLETKISSKLDFGIHLKPSYTHQNARDQSSRSDGALGLIPLSFPFYSPYKADGSLNISDQLVQEQRILEGVAINGTPVENLLATSTLVKNRNQRFKTFGNIFLNYEIIKGVKYRVSLGGDYDSYLADFYYPLSVGAYRIPAPRPDADGTQTRISTYNYLVENTLNYDFRIQKHSFNVLIGHTFQKERINLNKTTGTGYADDNIQNIAGASATRSVPKIDMWTLESFLSRIQYDYDAKYLVSLALRRDGSSRFGENNRWGNFPSASVGWVMSKENFFPENDFLNFAKLALSWGKTGNNQIGNYSSYALVTNVNDYTKYNYDYLNGSTVAPGYITSTSSNPNLGWEIANAQNIGLDLGFLKNRLNLSLAYYKTNTKGLLLKVPVPAQSGYSEALANVGEMENKGFEAQLSGNNFMIGKVAIGFNANATRNSNKVLALGPGQNKIATGVDQNFVTKVGGSIAEIYAYTVDGVYKTQAEIDNSPHLDGTLTGDYRVIDVNNDGKINEEDKTSKGSYAPKWTYGFGSDITYKRFNFSFDFAGIYGRTLLDGDMSSLTESGEGFAVPSQYYFENRYHPENNPGGFLGQPNFGNFSNSRKLVRSSVVVQRNNGDYFRLRNVRLAYTFDSNFLKKIKLSDLQLYVSGTNLFTKTRFRGWNPDGTTMGNILTSGYNTGGNYPIARTITFGLKATY